MSIRHFRTGSVARWSAVVERGGDQPEAGTRVLDRVPLRVCVGESIVSCVGRGVDICAVAPYESRERTHFRPVELVDRHPDAVSGRSLAGTWICGAESDGHIDVLCPSGHQAGARPDRTLVKVPARAPV